MANFRQVNKAIKAAFPGLDIEVVRGKGYVYFGGDDGFDKIDSVMANPTTTSTSSMTQMCIDVIEGAAS